MVWARVERARRSASLAAVIGRRTRAWALVAALCLAGPAVAEDGDAPGGSEAPAESDEAPSRLHRSLDRASDFAPAGVLLDHTHQQGDWTFLYRYQRVEKRNLLIGNKPITTAEVAALYPVTPLRMRTDIHTVGAMYAPRDRFTFALLLPIIRNRLEEQFQGAVFESESTGIGDAKLLFLIPFIQKGKEKTQFNFGISFPTGSIQQKRSNATALPYAVSAQRAGPFSLPYAMQLGSGSWDAIWGITYTGQRRSFSWGGQFESQYRISDNARGYKLGASYTASAWVAGGFGRWLSASGRFVWSKRNNVKGKDPDLVQVTPQNALVQNGWVSPMDNNLWQAGTTLEVGPGINVLIPFLGGQRFSVEALFPIYEDLDGIQLASDFTVTAGWQWLF